jgi:hypothetical protein
MKLQIIIEKGEDGLWGRIETPDYLPVTYGKTVEEVTSQLYDLIDDYLVNEPDKSAFWQNVSSAGQIEFEYVYDIQAFFESFTALNISQVARQAGINQSLMRQYASGVKHPSSEQARKIEKAIHLLATDLLKVSFGISA